MIHNSGEVASPNSQMLQWQRLDVSIPFVTMDLVIAVALITENNIVDILHSIVMEVGGEVIRFLVIEVGESDQLVKGDINTISWYIIAWKGAVDHTPVVNKLMSQNSDGNFASVLGLSWEQKVTQENIVLAGYIEKGYSSEGNQPSLRFSSPTLKAACYPVNTEGWMHRFVNSFPDINIVEALV